MTKARFVVGPPGTGKTHIFLLTKYKKFFKLYDPDKIVLISHTNTAVQEILHAVMDVPEIKERGYRRKFFENRICTIHHYCKKKLERKEVFNEQDNEDFKNLVRLDSGFAQSRYGGDVYKDHSFFKFIKGAYGHNRTLEEHWQHPSTDTTEYTPYHLGQLEKLEVVYKKYKKDNGLYDFADMIIGYNELKIKPDIEALVVDEAQDTNRSQLKAIFKMAENVKDGHFYLVGDPDQTIFEWAGSDAKYFHEISRTPWEDEDTPKLKEGKRCGEAINRFCKEIIAPIWKKFPLSSGNERIWLPAKYNKKYHDIPPGCKEGDTIKGTIYSLTDLRPSSNLKILIDKIRNTKQTFLFSYRGKPSDQRFRKFFEEYGIEYAHINSSAHVSVKELKAHDEWPSFTEGAPKSLKQLKDFWCYLSSKAIVHGKGTFKFEDWVNQDYTIDELINKKLLKPEAKLVKQFDLLRKRAKGCDGKHHEKRMLYIRKVLKNGFDFDGTIRVKYGSIHKVKGTTFNNVVGDLSTYRRKPEHLFIQKRLKYVLFSRGIYDAWVLRSETGKELGNYGNVQ